MSQDEAKMLLTADSHNYSQNLRILYITHYTSMYGANLALYNLILDVRERHGVIPSVLAPGEGDFTRMCREKRYRGLLQQVRMVGRQPLYTLKS